MDTSDITLRGVATTAAYLVAGAVATATLAVGLLSVLEPLRPAVYRALYLAVGPWSATAGTAALAFAAAGLLALGAVAVGATVPRGVDATLAGGVAGLAAGALALVAAAVYAGVEGLLAALLGVAAFAVALLLWLRRRGADSRGYAAVTGGVPVLALLLVLLAFGLGWGGGYDVVAAEVDAADVDGADADFADAPALRDALLTPAADDVYAYCDTEGDRRICRLSLRGYDDEAGAARFLARHGVRCPYLNGGGGAASGDESFVAVADGIYYRVSCRAYGD